MPVALIARRLPIETLHAEATTGDRERRRARGSAINSRDSTRSRSRCYSHHVADLKGME